MQICDFTSWIQLSATLNIAFVAIEYVKSYAKVLYNQVFNISDILESHFAPCIETLGDEETVNHLIPRQIGEKNTSSQIEKVKRDREVLTKKILTSKEEILAETNEKCNTRSTSSLSLFVFFFSLYGLFLAGMEKTNESYIHSVWIFLSIGALLYLILGWIFGERKLKCSFFNFASLWHPVIYSIVLLLLTLLIPILCSNDWLAQFESEYWNIVLLISLGLMFFNFVIFVSNIGIKAYQIRESIGKKSSPIKTECGAWRGQLNQLLSLEELHNGLNTD